MVNIPINWPQESYYVLICIDMYIFLQLILSVSNTNIKLTHLISFQACFQAILYCCGAVFNYFSATTAVKCRFSGDKVAVWPLLFPIYDSVLSQPSTGIRHTGYIAHNLHNWQNMDALPLKFGLREIKTISDGLSLTTKLFNY